MPIKVFMSRGKFINSYSNVFLVHFRSFFVLVHGPERVTVHPPPMRPSLFLFIRPPPISEVDAIK